MRRQIVGAAWHLSDHEKYKSPSDSICVRTGKVRWPDKPPEEVAPVEVQLVCEVSELVWEGRRIDRERVRLLRADQKGEVTFEWQSLH